MPHVRFRSLADICTAIGHVGFAPESGRLSARALCPLSAKSGHCRPDRAYSVAPEITASRHNTVSNSEAADDTPGLRAIVAAIVRALTV